MKTRRPRLFGPGTVLALVVAVVVLAANPSFRQRSEERRAQPIDVEQLRADLARQPKPQPLSKPEPAQLLAKGPTPALSPEQRSRVERIADAWAVERGHLVGALHAAAPAAPRSSKEDGLRTSLADYSELSRQFDRTRDSRWQEALAVLTDAQRKSLETQP